MNYEEDSLEVNKKVLEFKSEVDKIEFNVDFDLDFDFVKEDKNLRRQETPSSLDLATEKTAAMVRHSQYNQARVQRQVEDAKRLIRHTSTHHQAKEQ